MIALQYPMKSFMGWQLFLSIHMPDKDAEELKPVGT
jgi:hypothetical protein